MLADLTVCVVSLPERGALLAEALASVQQQTVRPAAVLVGIDPREVGEAENMNRLIRTATTTHVAFLHDDDLWTPTHLASGLRVLDGGADIAVSDLELRGRPRDSNFTHRCDYQHLHRTNWFPPSAVMAHRSRFLDRGGFIPTERSGTWVDWGTWRAQHLAGARYACTHDASLIYRFGPWGNGSW